jgi:hypothetical protein
MAGVTKIACIDMCRDFTASIDPIVTSNTVTDKTGMIDDCR